MRSLMFHLRNAWSNLYLRWANGVFIKARQRGRRLRRFKAVLAANPPDHTRNRVSRAWAAAQTERKPNRAERRAKR